MLAGLAGTARAADEQTYSRSVSPETFEQEPNCAGAVRVLPGRGRATEANLNGHTFRSVRVVGRAIGQRQIRLRFFRHASRPGLPKRPTLGVSAGCNSMGARYRLANGRLRWTGPVDSTEMGCAPARMANDRWLKRLLRTGMKARLKGKRLVLTRGKTRIVLRRIG